MRNGAGRLETVRANAARLDDLVFGQLLIDDGRSLLLSPTTDLAATPWGVLPSLARLPFSVVPSATLWCRAKAAPEGRSDGRAVLVAGPDLDHAEREVMRIARHHRNHQPILGDAATTTNLMTAMTDSALVHIACHGRFAPENPLFSSLQLADGPLFVYDIERIESPAECVVLSACYGGLTAARPGEQLLGTLASLIAIGTRTLIAATVPVPDRLDTVDVMDCWHEQFASGAPPSQALADARSIAPMVAGSFVCVGVG
jgi:hypothetical protein